MSVPTAVSQLMSLLEAEESTEEAPSSDSPESLSPSSTLAISLSRVGDPSQKFVSGTLKELSTLGEDDFGGPLHSFVIVGRRFHALERDFAARWSVNKETWEKVSNEVYKVRD
jgi:diphthine synthase